MDLKLTVRVQTHADSHAAIIECETTRWEGTGVPEFLGHGQSMRVCSQVRSQQRGARGAPNGKRGVVDVNLL